MKKKYSIFILIVLIIYIGYSSITKVKNDKMHFYFGQGESWTATYSITEAKSSYYDSLVIQFLEEENETMTKIGPIEYELIGSNVKIQSSYPLETQAIGSLHVPGRVSADFYDVKIDESMELKIKWQDKSETIKLEKQN